MVHLIFVSVYNIICSFCTSLIWIHIHTWMQFHILLPEITWAYGHETHPFIHVFAICLWLCASSYLLITFHLSLMCYVTTVNKVLVLLQSSWWWHNNAWVTISVGPMNKALNLLCSRCTKACLSLTLILWKLCVNTSTKSMQMFVLINPIFWVKQFIHPIYTLHNLGSTDLTGLYMYILNVKLEVIWCSSGFYFLSVLQYSKGWKKVL